MKRCRRPLGRPGDIHLVPQNPQTRGRSPCPSKVFNIMGRRPSVSWQTALPDSTLWRPAAPEAGAFLCVPPDEALELRPKAVPAPGRRRGSCARETWPPRPANSSNSHYGQADHPRGVHEPRRCPRPPIDSRPAAVHGTAQDLDLRARIRRVTRWSGSSISWHSSPLSVAIRRSGCSRRRRSARRSPSAPTAGRRRSHPGKSR